MAKAVSVQERLLAMEKEELQASFVQWVHANRFVIGSVLAILLVIGAGSMYWRYQKAVAREQLQTGIAAYSRGDAQKAVTALQPVGRSSLGNAERTLALFYLGEAQRSLGKNDEAIKGYEDALAMLARGKGESFFEQVLLVRLASLYASTGKEAEARKRYEEAAVLSGPLQTEARAAAARLAEKANDAATAKAHYEKLATLEPTYPLADVFREKVGK